MSYGIYLIGYICNAINALRLKHSKIVALIFFLLMVVMFSGVTKPSYKHIGAYTDGDNVRYEAMYDRYKGMSYITALKNESAYNVNSASGTGGITRVLNSFAYKSLAYIFSVLKIPFSIFLLFIFLVGSFLCLSTFKKITSNYSYIMMLYFGYYFLYDIQQIRNFLGVSVIIYSIKYLFEDKKLKYFISVCVASLFHVTMFTFSIFLLKDLPFLKFNSKKIIRYSLVACLLLSVLNLFGINLIKILASKIYSGAYISDSYNPIRPFIEIVQIGYFAYLSKQLNDENPSNNILSTIFSLNEISLVFVPLILISMTMDRLTRPVLLLDYAIFANNPSFELCVSKHDLQRFGIIIVVGAMALAFTRPLFIWIFDSNKLLALLGV